VRVSGAAAKKSVFIIDDHPVTRVGMRELIATEPDLKVCGEASGDHDVLSALRDQFPDVIILDLRLAQGSGLVLLRQILGIRPDARVIVHSMQDPLLFAPRAIESGAKGYVDKSAPPEELLTAIRTVLRDEVYGYPALYAGTNRDPSAPRPASMSPDSLTDRELEVLTLIGQGKSTREVAEACNLSVKTIETHREKIKRKLGIPTTPEFVRFAVQWVLESAK
jgi:DNA-binding NarL/FixJ family response regulator